MCPQARSQCLMNRLDSLLQSRLSGVFLMPQLLQPMPAQRTTLRRQQGSRQRRPTLSWLHKSATLSRVVKRALQRLARRYLHCGCAHPIWRAQMSHHLQAPSGKMSQLDPLGGGLVVVTPPHRQSTALRRLMARRGSNTR